MTYNNNKENQYKNISPVSNDYFNTIDYATNTFFSSNDVNKPYSVALKIRLQTLIKDRGMSESQFYKKLGISRNYWYLLSYGKQECPIELKVRISRLLNSDSSLIFQISNSHVAKPIYPPLIDKSTCENIQESKSEVSIK